MWCNMSHVTLHSCWMNWPLWPSLSWRATSSVQLLPIPTCCCLWRRRRTWRWMMCKTFAQIQKRDSCKWVHSIDRSSVCCPFHVKALPVSPYTLLKQISLTFMLISSPPSCLSSCSLLTSWAQCLLSNESGVLLHCIIEIWVQWVIFTTGFFINMKLLQNYEWGGLLLVCL